MTKRGARITVFADFVLTLDDLIHQRRSIRVKRPFMGTASRFSIQRRRRTTSVIEMALRLGAYCIYDVVSPTIEPQQTAGMRSCGGSSFWPFGATALNRILRASRRVAIL
jgi:hypothetical protein